jgi:hypothetical protein
VNLAAISLLVVGFSLLLSAESLAQDNSDSTESGIIWSVVGAGGVLNSSNDDGDTLSATLGQTAVDSVTVDDSTFGKIGYGIPRSAVTAHLGFWLPRRTGGDEPAPATVGATNAFALANHPNPFNESTTISYLLPMEGYVRLEIFDPTGRRVRLLVSGAQSAGAHRSEWDGHDDAGGTLATGVYIYRLELTSGTVQSRQSSSGTTSLVK